MSRDIESAKLSRWETAIGNTAGIRAAVRAEIYDTRLFFSSITSAYPWGGTEPPEPAYLNDSPIPQYPGWNPNNNTVTTFWNDNGTLKYNNQGNATPVTTSYTGMVGVPSVYGNYLFIARNGGLYRYTISWTLIAARNTNPLSGSILITGYSPAYCVYGVSNTECIVVHSNTYNYGMLSADFLGNIGGTVTYSPMPVDRFAFPKFIDYTNGDSERTTASLMIFSGALKLNNMVYVYVSNCYEGSVQAAGYDIDTGTWGDIFTAVPTNIKESMCEFRVTNAYSRNGTAYLVGQYHRKENLDLGNDKVYSMILSSSDGRTFSLDRFGLVSDIGYRFLAVCGTSRLFLANCNNICYGDMVTTFDGINGTAGTKISIPETSIKQFKDTDLSTAVIDLKAGDESLIFDSLISEENLVKVYTGYLTPNGVEDELYATYIVDKIQRSFRDGKRALSLNLINETSWKLANLSSPFYSEILSKSSVYVDLTEEESGELYVADSIRFIKDSFSIDFWDSEPHEPEEGSNTTGINVLKDGGVTHYETGGTTHDLSVRTKEIKEVLGLSQNPIITATTVTANLYGWSHVTPEGAGDRVELILITRDPETGIETPRYSQRNQRWPNSRATSPTGSEPASVYIDTGLTIGHEIVKVGIQIINSVPSWFCVERVDVTSGARIYITPTDGNTPWEFKKGSGIRIPGKGRPYIMFSQKPFDAYNFKISATFRDTASRIQDSLYPVGGGLVGLAEDGLNYIVGRYNKSNGASGSLEIVKVRDGIETVLAELILQNPLDEVYKLMFEHRNGRFILYKFDSTTNLWSNSIGYDWTTADWMYTSETTVKKCGIYGIRDTPKFRIPGFYINADQEDQSPSDGIPMLPGESHTDFPASGEVEIGNSIYTYTSKNTPASLPRGPYQFKKSEAYEAGHGLEMGYFCWNAGIYTYSDKLMASDSGYTYDIDNSLFQVPDGEGDYLGDRSRHYSANATISKASFSNSNRMYFADGLLGITLISGEQEKHLSRALCMQRQTGEIYCSQYAGSNGDVDATVEDLIEKVVASAGGKSGFPGDTIIASQVVNGDYLVKTIPYAEGIDLRYETATHTSSSAKVNVVPDNVDGTYLHVKIDYLTAENYEVSLRIIPSNTLIEKRQITLSTSKLKYRIVFHDNFITVYICDQWIHTFGFNQVEYDIDINVYLSGIFTATNIRLLELSDWREAIYIDLESNGTSALGNIIQERPIEQYAWPNGSIQYTYTPTRDAMLMLYEPKDHQWVEAPPYSAASDAIIYTAKEVKSLINSNFAATYGFSTRVYRFPNLSVGAYRAAKIMLDRLYEQAKTHSIAMRPDMRLLPGDIYQINYVASGTGTQIDRGMIIEQMELRITVNDAPTMVIKGREILGAFTEWIIDSITLRVS